MKNLSTTVATYESIDAAEKDWTAVEAAAESGEVDLADAAIVTLKADDVTIVERHAHHGWGKGAVAGAVVGVLFPPAVLGAAAVGAASGGIVARLSRSLDKDDIRELKDVMAEGQTAMVVMSSQATTDAAVKLLSGSTKSLTKDSSTAEEVMAALEADSSAAS